MTYQYTLVGLIKQMGIRGSAIPSRTFFVLRFALLLVLSFLMLKPQAVDKRSKVPVDGIDIMLALDLSGSMQALDDLKERKTRVSIAKEEAVRFIKERDDDSIGLVVFGQNALSRAPLTLDKKILIEIINELDLGNTVDPNGTVVTKALATALNRLKDSAAKSKIIILLTDGVPSHHDIQPHTAIDIAKKLNVKIYTIGIGGKHGGYLHNPMAGYQLAYPPLNTALLEQIAYETGGKFFRAKNQKDMRSVYEVINRLEKTKREANLYTQYKDTFVTGLWIALLLITLYSLLSSFVWRVI
ncbi:MAG TPA: VWA domain-containing protein [Candidatus Babeliales bacterium]|nr:VWA domain-containing protein [Candidatus Babeliales bacterium]